MALVTERRDLRILPESRVTIDLPPLQARQAISLLLESLELEYDVNGEVIQVAFPEDLRRQLPTSAIDVRHLLDSASGGFDEDTIIDLVTTCVAPDQWDEVGGPGTQEVFRGLLVFRQTYEISRQVQELIDVLSEHCLPVRFGQVAHTADSARQPVWVGLSQGEERLIQNLQTKVSLTPNNISILNAIEELCRACSVPVYFDRVWFEDTTFPLMQLPKDLRLDRVPARDVLDAIEARELAGFMVANGMLMVIDPDYAASHRLIRLYPLRLPKQDDVPQLADQVADMLVERFEPDAWSDNGGYGIISTVNDEWLLVVQTLPMHRRVEEALAKLHRGDIPPLPEP
jgi:hypothetical protein